MSRRDRYDEFAGLDELGDPYPPECPDCNGYGRIMSPSSGAVVDCQTCRPDDRNTRDAGAATLDDVEF